MDQPLFSKNYEAFLIKTKAFFNDLIKSHNNNLKYIRIKNLIDSDQVTPYHSTFFYVINANTLSFEYIGSSLEYGIGLKSDVIRKNGLHFFWKRIHPEDLDDLLLVWKKLTDYLLNQEGAENGEHITYTWNYRFKNKNETYVNIVENVTPVRCDALHETVCMLSYCTVINSEINMKVTATANIINNNTYEKISFSNTPDNQISSKISRREKDIINLLALHLSSKEIGDKLCISTNTVNTHRRNIIKKLNIASTGELIGILRNKGYWSN
ncbi:LuxR C-terminal-related transcriptional regulator [Lentiprolixibacter aurantiacus]|uniref:LuxR C-terminal-related transcriptional regulator n=1 Tax=Lentiprolixibacter aurantiacus TaxID=2993939 RepID=A0AAE3MKX8_9FLAO|nr:LuxR C-terminal-related transcriptional regulator [Lentiprolixibacter aurantiacus]MCX2719725.1 LuxR C-terminal-related transcriptional regulator [Lentiprolixibacter aurantiacus]